MEMECSNCFYCKPINRNGRLGTIHKCLRYPPTFREQKHLGREYPYSEHVDVYANSWCGEWRPNVDLTDQNIKEAWENFLAVAKLSS